MFHASLKHIDVRGMHIADSTSKGLIQPIYCPTGEMIADILTKALSADKFNQIKELVGSNWRPLLATQGRVLEVRDQQGQ